MTRDSGDITGARQVCEELHRHGVTDVFGLMGDGNVQWIPMLEGYGISYHASRHEAGAIAMADAYSRATGRMGVCTVTHGPGLTHALSCLLEARKAGSQVVLLAGETPIRATAYSCQDIDHAGVLRSIGCESVRIPAVGTLARDLARAFRRCSTGQKPITVLLPTDVQSASCRYSPVVVAASDHRRSPSAGELAELAEIVEQAERPLILAGRGAVRSDARQALEQLAERIDALVATTVLAKGFFHGNRFALDIVGGFSTTTAKGLIGEADLVLAFGTTLSPWTTLSGAIFSPTARIVQVSDDPAVLGANAPIDLGVIGDVRASAEGLDEELARRQHERHGRRTDELAERIASGRAELVGDVSTDDLIDPRAVMYKLDEMLPAERTLAIDGGWYQVLPVRLLTSTDARGFMFLQTYQAVGPGLAAAVGAATGRPDRVTALVVGDGGLSMSLGELETVTRLKLPIVVVVVNDGAYHAEVHGLAEIGQPTDTAYHRDVDFAAVATALGGQGATVRRLADFEEHLAGWLDDPQGPLVLDCKVPCPIRYWDDQEWLEDIWHEPRPER
jgi:thiamine pyrophosphate-dependent acetolactate synthase large subunit-like protein